VRRCSLFSYFPPCFRASLIRHISSGIGRLAAAAGTERLFRKSRVASACPPTPSFPVQFRDCPASARSRIKGLCCALIYLGRNPDFSLRDVSVGHCAEIDLIDTSSSESPAVLYGRRVRGAPGYFFKATVHSAGRIARRERERESCCDFETFLVSRRGRQRVSRCPSALKNCASRENDHVVR